MRRDTDPGAAGMEDHYYLHDDFFNVVGLADASGALRERYEYADYGPPTIYNGDGTATRTESAYGNPFLFQKACTRTPYRFSTGAPGLSSFLMHAITTSTNSATPRRQGVPGCHPAPQTSFHRGDADIVRQAGIHPRRRVGEALFLDVLAYAARRAVTIR